MYVYINIYYSRYYNIYIYTYIHDTSHLCVDNICVHVYGTRLTYLQRMRMKGILDCVLPSQNHRGFAFGIALILPGIENWGFPEKPYNIYMYIVYSLLIYTYMYSVSVSKEIYHPARKTTPTLSPTPRV